jgi:hypothetical protein
MPPFMVHVKCVDCPYATKTWSIRAMIRADKHAEKYGHALRSWRLDRHGVWVDYINVPSPAPEEIW